MLNEPCKSLGCGRNGGPLWDRRARDHDHGKAQRPRGLDFRNGGIAAGIFGEYDFDAVFAKQPHVILGGERASGLDELKVRQSDWRGRPVDEAYDVAVLRRGAQFAERKAAGGAEHGARHLSQGLNGGRHVLHFDPMIALVFFPGMPVDCQKRNACRRGRFDGVPAHLACKGMRGIDEKIYALLTQIADKALYAAKAAAAYRDRQGAGSSGSAGKRKHRLKATVARQPFSEQAGFGGAAQE